MVRPPRAWGRLQKQSSDTRLPSGAGSSTSTASNHRPELGPGLYHCVWRSTKCGCFPVPLLWCSTLRQPHRAPEGATQVRGSELHIFRAPARSICFNFCSFRVLALVTFSPNSMAFSWNSPSISFLLSIVTELCPIFTVQLALLWQSEFHPEISPAFHLSFKSLASVQCHSFCFTICGIDKGTVMDLSALYHSEQYRPPKKSPSFFLCT